MHRTTTGNCFFLLMASTVFLIITVCSCTKKVDNWIDKKADTIYDTVTTLPDTRILNYKVANAGGDDAIQAHIDHDARTITVYLPHYYELQYLDAEISLPAGVSINHTDDLVPVFSETPFEYELTGKKGEKVTYTVNIVIQQPDVWLKEASTASTKKTYTMSSMFLLEGRNLVPSYNVTTLHLVDAQGNIVFQVPPPTQTTQLMTTGIYYSFVGSGAVTRLENNTDYWLEVHCYALAYKMTYPIRFSK